MIDDEFRIQLKKDYKKLLKDRHKQKELLKEMEALSDYKIPRPAVKKAKLLRFMPEIIYHYFNGYGANRVCKWLARYKKFKVSETYLVKITREVLPNAFTDGAGTFDQHIKRRS